MSTWVPVVAAYLLGSISFSYLIVRLLKGIDIRTVGSGNAGATNVLRAAGKGPALVALVLDIGKGALAVVLARALGAGPGFVAAVGVAAVLGHVYPIWMGFKGGKGVATAAGTLLALVPWATAVAGLGFAVLVAWKRQVSLGSIVASVMVPPLIGIGWAMGWVAPERAMSLLVATSAIAALVVVKHRDNIARLMSGTEPKLGQRSAVKAEAGAGGRAET